jgi:hypothetical protein
MSTIMGLVNDTSYGKQKANLVRDFEAFLSANYRQGVDTSSSCVSACPADITKFLVDRDARGRTQVHVDGCPFLGLHKLHECGCPLRLAAGSIDSMIGRLRAHFNSIGRPDSWRVGNPSSNPCDSPHVKTYLKGVGKEQRAAHVTPKQSPPIFSDTLRLVSAEILGRLRAPDLSVTQRFVLLRDRAFFLALWWVGDRAGDLGRSKGVEVTKLLDGSFFLNHTLGKTIREGDDSLLLLPQVIDEPLLDPVSALQEYVDFCSTNGIDVISHYLFRPVKASGRHESVQDSSFTSNDANSRLRTYCKSLGIPALKSHGHRSGVAITLALLGVSQEQVMEHCRWGSSFIFKHYTKVGRVERLKGSAAVLRDSVVRDGDGVSLSDAATAFYRDMNCGVGFTRAFP